MSSTASAEPRAQFEPSSNQLATSRPTMLPFAPPSTLAVT